MQTLTMVYSVFKEYTEPVWKFSILVTMTLAARKGESVTDFYFLALRRLPLKTSYSVSNKFLMNL